MKTIYALLVGIDDYPSPVPRLQGCVNDLKEMKLFLEGRVAPGEGRAVDEALKIRTLSNDEATREAFIKAFVEHLGQAGEGDVALFCYSGHGSQERAPEEFWHIEPDRLDETLVLYDSRTEGSHDLADKELAKLIHDVAAKGPHVVLILDCCHSGSGTRNFQDGVRRAETDTRPRPIDTFLVTPQQVEAMGVVTRNLSQNPSGWNTGGRHVLLAACRDDEEAKEHQSEGVRRGAFSYFLGDALRSSGGEATYRNLFDRASALLRGQVPRQSPQLEATQPDDLNQPFLGGALGPTPRYAVVSRNDGGWTADLGRIHGIPEPTADDAVTFALFDFKVKDDALTDPKAAVGKARVVKVGPVSSTVELEGSNLSETGPFKAMVLHQPTAKLKVALEGDEAAISPLRAALETAAPDGSPSLFVRPIEAGEAADYRVVAREGEYRIIRPGDDRPLVDPVRVSEAEAARRIVGQLEQIERWKSIVELQNPNSQIGDGELEFKILLGEKELVGDQRLTYDGDEPPQIVLKLKNKGPRTLFVGLLDLPNTFGVFPLQPDRPCQKLAPGEETAAFDGAPIPVTVPDAFWKAGVGEILDVLKLVVSTQEFDARRLQQEDLDIPDPDRVSRATRGLEAQTRGGDGGAEGGGGTLDRLMARVQTRHIGGTPARIDDWRTKQFVLTIVRPLPATRIEPGRAVVLTNGVRIEPHPGLSAASARLASLPSASRSIGDVNARPLPRLLYDDPSAVRPFEFATTRAVGGGLNVLELSGVQDPSVVTPDHPLTIVVSQPLAADELILAVGFDGEFHLPLGRAEAAGNETRVILDRLPQPDEAQTRSLGGSLRIVFQKVVSNFLGTEYPYPILAAADVDEDLSVRYDADPASVKARVARASRIALFVHGIIGDTREMAASLRRAGASTRYDLILTFDYENLNTEIAKTAQALKQRLEAVGLGEGHGRRFDVFAHSMGGLVSRWFIEREGGARIASRLIMLGTPNDGSPWPSVESWATTALAVGLNELSKVVWPASILAGLTKATKKKVEVTLDEMTTGSDFLADILGSPDPKIPYILIAGDTSLIPAPMDAEEARLSKLKRLVQRLWQGDLKYDVVSQILFSGSNNDFAVSVESMRKLPANRDPAMRILPAACDHMTYFRHPEGLKAIVESL